MSAELDKNFSCAPAFGFIEIMSILSRLKYAIRRPTILGGKRFHPKSPLATKRYQSYGNRYLRSLKLPVRLGGSGGTQLCGSGSCLINTQYGSAGTIKLLTYQFSGQSPVVVTTLTDSISFNVGVSDVYPQYVFYTFYGGNKYWIRPSAYYSGGVLFEFSFAGSPFYPSGWEDDLDYATQFPKDATAGDSFTYSSGSFIDLHALSPVQFDNLIYLRNGIGSVTSFAFFSVDSSFKTDPLGASRAYPNFAFLSYELVGTAQQAVFIQVFDHDGNVLRTDRGEIGNVIDYPAVDIVEGDAGDGFAVQSAKYPQVWYSVPTNYSSCECGDFQKYTSVANIPVRDYRDWRGSGAGPFNPCKHIMAVKRVLAIPQNYTDYISYSNFPYVPELLEMNYRVDSLGRPVKIKPRNFTRIQNYLRPRRATDEKSLNPDGTTELINKRRSPRSGYHT
ncbi:MAG: hypothetical protein [Caudoviricetes sp.]|nr:MAG: hypothetical protein [Caudoviricetes sp.]